MNYVISRLTVEENKSEMALNVAQTALKEMGLTSRAAFGVFSKLSDQRAAIRQFVTPIGDTCDFAQIGKIENGAFAIDSNHKDEILKTPSEIGPSSDYEILISELDIINMTCKFSIRGESEEKRIPGTITDPAITIPNNPYTGALSEKRWIRIKGKPEIIEGETTRLFISDVVP